MFIANGHRFSRLRHGRLQTYIPTARCIRLGRALYQNTHVAFTALRQTKEDGKNYKDHPDMTATTLPGDKHLYKYLVKQLARLECVAGGNSQPLNENWVR